MAVTAAEKVVVAKEVAMVPEHHRNAAARKREAWTGNACTYWAGDLAARRCGGDNVLMQLALL